jgi:hypothetical protein
VYKRSFATVTLDKIIRLKEGSLLALGRENRAKLVLIKFRDDGEILWEKSLNHSRLYGIEDAVSTKDGGFILNAQGGINILKFSKEGKLEFKTKIVQYKYTYGRTIIETEEGYLSTNQINNGADILVVKLDLLGNIVEDKIYTSKKRLHANHIIHSFDGGYLMSIGTEIYNTWLVKMDKDTNISVDFSQKIHSDAHVRKKKSVKAKIHILEDRFDYLGGSIRDIVPSKEGNILYALAGATGFKIFDVSDMQEVKELGSFRKSKLKLKVTANRIRPIGRKYEGKGDYAYDSPFKLVLSKDEQRAYIIDLAHGFYILDISDKSNPILLGSNSSLKGSTFALSKDEKTVYLAYYNKIKKVDITNPKDMKSKTLKYQSTWENGISDILLSASEEIFYTSNVKELIMYNIQEERVIERIDTLSLIYKIILSDDKKSLYLSNGLGLYGYSIDAYNMQEKFEVSYKSRVKSFVVSEDEKYFYLSSDKGVKALNITDTLNPKVENIYSNPARDYVSVTVASEDKKTLYLGFGIDGIARVRL